MQPSDLNKIRTLSSPTVDPAGEYVVFAVARPDTDENTYRSSLWRVLVKGESKSQRLTHGTADSAPSYSPDGQWIAFLRSVDKKPAQLWVMPARGGDGRVLTDASLGVGSFRWSPGSDEIAYAARVPEQGRYGTDADITADSEAPRLIEHARYLADGLGYRLDRPSKIFVISATDESDDKPASTQITSGPADDLSSVWLEGGARIGFVSSRDAKGRALHDSIVTDLFSVDRKGKKIKRHTDGSGDVAALVTDNAATVAYYAMSDLGKSKQDFVARNHVWFRDGDPTPLTDAESDHIPGIAAVVGESALASVFETRGDATVRIVGSSGKPVLGGNVTVTGLASGGSVIAAVASSPESYGELYVGTIRGLKKRTDFAASLTGSAAPIEGIERTASSTDGYPVHGWVFKPSGKGPHPVVLMVHGGPYSQYTGNLFDEAQVLAGAGYAVVMCNPRGGLGYGATHGRAIKEAFGTHDVDDILAFLDDALTDPALDAKRVGIMGGSYGGFMTTWIVSHTNRFTAAISERAVNAWDSFTGTSDIGTFFADEYAGPNIMTQSPLTHAGNIETPMLIIHSERDFRCPLEQGQRLFALLKRRGVPAKFLIFPGEGHELSRSGQPRHRLQRFEHILAWWAEYLPTKTNKKD